MLQGDSGMEFYHRDGTTKFQTVDFPKKMCYISISKKKKNK